MDYLGPALVALAVIAVVAVAAVAFEPANPFAHWLKLAETYGTQRRPAQVTHPGQAVLFAGLRSGFKPLGDEAPLDAAVDDDGLWLLLKGERPEGCPPGLKIPGTHVRFQQQRGEQYRFEVFAQPPVRMALTGELGNTVMQRCQSGS